MGTGGGLEVGGYGHIFLFLEVRKKLKLNLKKVLTIEYMCDIIGVWG